MIYTPSFCVEFLKCQSLRLNSGTKWKEHLTHKPRSNESYVLGHGAGPLGQIRNILVPFVSSSFMCTFTPVKFRCLTGNTTKCSVVTKNGSFLQRLCNFLSQMEPNDNIRTDCETSSRKYSH